MSHVKVPDIRDIVFPAPFLKNRAKKKLCPLSVLKNPSMEPFQSVDKMILVKRATVSYWKELVSLFCFY